MDQDAGREKRHRQSRPEKAYKTSLGYRSRTSGNTENAMVHIPKTNVTPEKGAVWDNQPNNAEEHKRCIFNTRTKILNTMDAK